MKDVINEITERKALSHHIPPRFMRNLRSSLLPSSPRVLFPAISLLILPTYVTLGRLPSLSRLLCVQSLILSANFSLSFRLPSSTLLLLADCTSEPAVSSGPKNESETDEKPAFARHLTVSSISLYFPYFSALCTEL